MKQKVRTIFLNCLFLCLLPMVSQAAKLAENPTTTASMALFRKLISKYESNSLDSIAGFVQDTKKLNFSEFSHAVVDELISAASDSIINRNIDRKLFSRELEIKAYYIVKENLKKSVGLESKTLSDGTVFPKGPKAQPRLEIISTDPLDGMPNDVVDIKTGLVVTYPSDFAVSSQSNQFEYTWTAKNERYKLSGKVESVVDKLSQLVGRTSPQYASLKKDGVISIAIVSDQSEAVRSFLPGSNESEPESMLTHHISMLQKRNMTFEVTDPKNIKSLPLIANALTYFSGRISGSTTSMPVYDILIKQGHNSGENKVFMRLPKRFRVLRATGKNSLGTPIHFEYLFPDVTNAKTMSQYSVILVDTVKSWILNREKLNPTQFVYVNSVCQSMSQAIFEIPGLLTPKNSAIILATDADVSPMIHTVDRYTSTMAVFDGLVNEDNFEAIRKRISQIRSPREQSALKTSRSVYLLPNEPEYIDRFLSHGLNINQFVYRFENGNWVPNTFVSFKPSAKE